MPKTIRRGFLAVVSSAGALLLATADSAQAVTTAGEGCHLGGHPESNWLWLLLLLVPLLLRGRIPGRRRR